MKEQEPLYFKIEPVYPPKRGEFRIANASVGVCVACGDTATGMGGSDNDLCYDCGRLLLSGQFRKPA